jgi:hypothetical protein
MPPPDGGGLAFGAGGAVVFTRGGACGAGAPVVGERTGVDGTGWDSVATGAGTRAGARTVNVVVAWLALAAGRVTPRWCLPGARS